MEKEIKCLRCGLCCWYIDPLTEQLKFCKYLGQLRDGTKYCKRWKERNRLLAQGTFLMIDKKSGVMCLHRNMVKYDFIGCPFNTDQEIAPWCEQHQESNNHSDG